MNTYKHSKVEQAAEIISAWIIGEINELKCLNKIVNLGISKEDADYMMDVCNGIEITDYMSQIESFSEDFEEIEDEDHNPYNDYLRYESGVYAD